MGGGSGERGPAPTPMPTRATGHGHAHTDALQTYHERRETDIGSSDFSVAVEDLLPVAVPVLILMRDG